MWKGGKVKVLTVLASQQMQNKQFNVTSIIPEMRQYT
jgi:hypothetical protein